MDNAAKYGVCHVCGASRESRVTETEFVRHMELVCPNGHPQVLDDVWVDDFEDGGDAAS